MAAYSHTRAGSRTSVGGGDQELPNGSCNYRDLSIGSRAPTCGCARFWLNVSHYNANDTDSERAWCFCGHHACFHNAFSQQQEEREQTLSSSRVGNPPLPSNGGDGNEAAASGLRYSTPSKPLAGLGIRPDSRSQSQSINTRVFRALNEFARNQEEGQAGSDTTSRLPSTAAPSLIEEPQWSPNRLIQEKLAQYRPMAPPVNIPTGPVPRPVEEYSATEVATPSIAGTPDFRALASSSTGNGPSPGHLQPSRLEPREHRSDPPGPESQEQAPTRQLEQHTAVPNLPMSAIVIQNIIQTYGRRLDVLESLSFSNVPVEELQERFEHFDGRILDLEHWRIDHEQAHPPPEMDTPSSSKRRRLLPTETSSFASDASFDSNAAAHTEAAVLATLAANAETHPRIDALENRVQDLENAALPSYTRPWHVQVVLLPWGRDLKGIWFFALDATQHSMRSATQASEEWTGAQSGPKLSFRSTTTGAWTTESIQAWASEAQEWLSPKACGPSGAVFQRLASRGMVRDVTLMTPDARHIFNAINAAFGDISEDVNINADTPKEVHDYQGLQEQFIPLRKVRKSARLRFLSPSEMVTSASWHASFLDSSVFMKVTDGQRRLYVTTPAAYVQPTGEAWTWKTIRDLPVAQASLGERVAEAGKMPIHSYWTYNDRLDQIVSLHSSFATHESQWSTRSQFALDDNEAVEEQPPSPHSDLRPQRQRTVSLPESGAAVELYKDAVPKRRVASFEPKASATLHIDEYGAEIVAKRRRISASPEAERRGVNFTPRWSREPPSPFTSEAAIEARSQGASSSRKRGNTPFAYATPHSNNNFVGRVEFDSGDGDTEVATDILEIHSERGGEDEWEGVEDGNTDGKSIADEQDVDEDDLEDGLTIYEG